MATVMPGKAMSLKPSMQFFSNACLSFDVIWIAPSRMSRMMWRRNAAFTIGMYLEAIMLQAFVFICTPAKLITCVMFVTTRGANDVRASSTLRQQHVAPPGQ